MTLGRGFPTTESVPKDLAALLVEEGAAPADLVERALVRQREAGGALDTALLEVGAIDEEALLPFLARAAELPAAPDDAWSGSDTRARRVFPSRVAERHGLAPFALDGRELSLVATHPVDVGLLDEISFMLSLHLTAHVGPEWRVRELIHRIYGAPMPPRLAALAKGSSPPVEGGSEAQAGAPAPQGEPHGPPPAPPPTGFERDESEPLEPLAAALEQALADFDITVEEPPAEEPEAPQAPGGPAEPPRPPPDRKAPPHWKLDDARAALVAAEDRDEVVLAALRYARDFLEFAALFAVTRDAIAGHDALGHDDARERARAVAIYSVDPGMFKTVVETGSPYLGPVSADVPANASVLMGLGRGAPRTALVYPVVLRDRTVCILYADNGEAPVSPRRLGNLLLFLSTVGAAFERIIRDRKKRPKRRAAEAPEVARGEAAPEPSRPATAEGQAPPAPEPPEPPPVESQAEAPSGANAMEAALASIDVDVEVGGAGDGGARGSGEALASAEPVRETGVAEWADAGQGAAEAAPAAPLGEAPAPVTAESAPAPSSPEAASSADSLDDLERQFFGTVGEPSAVAPAPVAGADGSGDFAAREEGPGEAPAAPAASADESGDAAAHEERRGESHAAPAASADESAEAAAREEGRGEPPAAPAAEPEPSMPAASAPDAASAAASPPEPETPAPPAGVERTQEPLPVPADTPPPRAAPPPAPAPPETPVALADRALDPDAAASSAARDALAARRRDPKLRPANEKLRRALLSGIASRATRAARALGAMRDVEAIPLLVQVLETSEPEPAQAAADALAAITMQRLGTDVRKWLLWWKQNRGRGRADWVFSGLTSEDRETRAIAEAELREAGDAPVEYSPDMPAEELRKAARAWASWWARSGHVL